MIRERLNYFVARLMSRIGINQSPASEAVLVKHDLNRLRGFYKTYTRSSHVDQLLFSPTHTFFGSTLFHIVGVMGKPAKVRKSVRGGVTHTRLLFETPPGVDGSHTIVHFINQEVSAVSYFYQTENVLQKNAAQQLLLNLIGKERYLLTRKAFSLSDREGNQLVYSPGALTEISFVKMDRSIEQNINAAVFCESFSELKASLLTREIQLTP